MEAQLPTQPERERKKNLEDDESKKSIKYVSVGTFNHNK
jgi:hypothetical protein